ncbi:hypothetical protein JJV70_04495 [Streptomyces sp. JJ66]|uniref:hypothetical protein n=1 Tax=Streptomyces sp. JJ66 TaxID=2803843 RepID=UPI001C5A3EC6|nr:hypothetical protein [Streptomyces sp. JJ66]MBW1601375.1 hypothetical protein [Streptomyces sp. JJ66]
MGSQGDLTPRMTEEPGAAPAPGDPEATDATVTTDEYAFTAQGPVTYVAIGTSEGVLGFLWASDAEGAAGFEPSEDAGEAAFHAAVAWARLLREHRAQGLAPGQALAALRRTAGDDAIGRPIPGTEGEAPSLTALREAP